MHNLFALLISIAKDVLLQFEWLETENVITFVFWAVGILRRIGVYNRPSYYITFKNTQISKVCECVCLKMPLYKEVEALL